MWNGQEVLTSGREGSNAPLKTSINKEGENHTDTQRAGMGPDILMGETWRKKVRKEKLRDRRQRVAEPHRGRETETKVEQVRERSAPESMKHGTFTG